jgi:acetyl-CoA carboxylase biotin carboxyl carrier protein
MRTKEIKKLITLLEQSNINELEVSRWGNKVRISKSMTSSIPGIGISDTMAGSVQIPAKPTHEIAPPPEATPPATPMPTSTETSVISENIFEVKSPMVGTFYHAPAPDAEPYVQIGDIVSANQVLCIIEAMKLMNEIEADVRGRVLEILVENGQPVEYNQVMFKIEKL